MKCITCDIPSDSSQLWRFPKKVDLGVHKAERRAVEDEETSLSRNVAEGRSGTREAEKDVSLAATVSNDDSTLACKHKLAHYLLAVMLPWLLAIPDMYSTSNDDSQPVIQLFSSKRGVSRTNCPVQNVCSTQKLFQCVDIRCLVCVTHSMKRHTGSLSLSQEE